MKRVFLFDWGNTIMRDFPGETGAMFNWKQVEAMPDADKLLMNLAGRGSIYLATNAADSGKEDIRKALERVELSHYFTDIFCYREIGYSKPSENYFRTILERVNADVSEIIMVGDSLASDIEGAESLGIDTVLYDRDNVYSDYMGNRVTDLMDVLHYCF